MKCPPPKKCRSCESSLISYDSTFDFWECENRDAVWSYGMYEPGNKIYLDRGGAMYIDGSFVDDSISDNCNWSLADSDPGYLRFETCPKCKIHFEVSWMDGNSVAQIKKYFCPDCKTECGTVEATDTPKTVRYL